MKTKTYSELKQAHREEFNAFEGIFFAFSNPQFAEGMAKVGLQPEDTAKVSGIGAGGYILKTRVAALKELLNRHDEEMKQLRKDHKQLLAAIVYELGNHEYCITHDPTDALEALDLTLADVPADLMEKAKKQALALATA
jgi:hypothetical protein